MKVGKLITIVTSVVGLIAFLTIFGGCSPCSSEKKKIKELQAMVDSLKADLELMTRVAERLRENLKDANEQNIQLNEEILELKTENLKLRDSVDTMQKRVRDLQKELTYWKPRWSERQETAVQTVLNNTKLTTLVASRPPSGDKWVCSERRQIHFLTKNILLLVYHGKKYPKNKGLMVLRVSDPKDLRTWRVIWQTRL